MTMWDECRTFFEPDGSLRDLYARGGGLASWDAVLRIARSTPTRFEVDGQPRSLPASPQEALALRAQASPLLSMDWGGLLLNAHFFTEDDIEVDLNPRDVNSPARFDALIAFMKRLAAETGLTVVLTPENCVDEVYLEAHPTGVITRAD